jgi:threonine aldolase
MFHYVDLRSDTVTRPTEAMREAMWAAPVGDDVYEDDPTVAALQNVAAERFGMEAALFCASGTMTNQIAIRLHCPPFSEMICEAEAHVFMYEGGGPAAHSAASVMTLKGDRGRLTAAQIAEAIRPEDIHHPSTRLVALENTANRGGGACYDWAEIERIRALCTQRGLALHLDGARLMNALVRSGQDPKAYGRTFNSISLCLSKGLGAPVGSLLMGTHEFIHRAKRVRKLFGGGWRQAGMLAAAGLYALDHHVARLAEDHARAAVLGQAVEALPYVEQLRPVETNLVLFKLAAPHTRVQLLAHLKEYGVLAGGFGERMVRLVTHLDVSDEGVEKTIEALKRFG